MKKLVVASLLVCACIASGARQAYAQAAPANGQIQMSDEEYKAYNDAINATTPQAKAAGLEAYLAKYPQSAVKLDTLITLMITYSQFDAAKTLDTADKVLQLDPNSIRALTFEVYLRRQSADALTDPAAKQAALDAAASYAQKGLAATKPKELSDADFKKITDAAYPIFYSAIGYAAFTKKDSAAAIAAYKKELSSVPVDATKTPGPLLQDTYYLGVAYYQSTPPDYLDCAFYADRAAAFAPDTFKAQMLPTAKYCYKKYHGGDDGFDAVTALATANLFAPPSLATTVKPAPTPADIVNQVFASTPDLATLAVGDKEYVIQNGTPDQASKVWDTVKGKSVEIPGALVIDNSTPNVLKVAVSDDAVQSKTADFTFNLTPPEEIPEPKANATPAQKLAYKKAVAAAQKLADDTAAATKVGSTVTLDGTYDSYTAKPIMIIMINGSVVLPKPTKPAAPVHHTAATHK